MIGTNTLSLNQATINQAVEDYLNTRLLLVQVKVQSVRQPGHDDFTVIVETVERPIERV